MALDILELRKLCIPKNIRITLHVVIGNHESDLFLITAYFPSFDKWESDFKTRKENA